MVLAKSSVWVILQNKKLPSVDSAGGCFDSSCSPLQLFDSHFVSSLVVTDCTRFRAKYLMILLI